MKRDDLTGLALGGNKIRKLGYILTDALHQGCDTIITAGAAQSKHCRQTAAAAAKLNLACHLLLGGEAPLKAQGNLLLDHIFDCHIHWTLFARARLQKMTACFFCIPVERLHCLPMLMI